MEKSFQELYEEYDIRIKDSKLNFHDVVEKIICSKDPKDYIRRVKAYKENFDIGDGYIDERVIRSMIYSSRSKIAKDIVKKFRNIELYGSPTIINTEKGIFKFCDQYVSILKDGENIWFKGKDIATILGYKDTNYCLRIQIDDKDKKYAKDLPPSKPGSSPGSKSGDLKGNDGNVIYINESALYELIFGSKMKQAKIFTRWVTSEVLPSIRKYGNYSLRDLNPKYVPSIIIDVSKYFNSNCFYVLNIKDNIYKFGNTFNFEKRLSDHRREWKDLVVIKVYELFNIRYCYELETKVKEYAYSNSINYDLDGHIEILKSNETFTIEKILQDIEKMYKKLPYEQRLEDNNYFENDMSDSEETLSESDDIVVSLKNKNNNDKDTPMDKEMKYNIQFYNNLIERDEIYKFDVHFDNFNKMKKDLFDKYPSENKITRKALIKVENEISKTSNRIEDKENNISEKDTEIIKKTKNGKIKIKRVKKFDNKSKSNSKSKSKVIVKSKKDNINEKEDYNCIDCGKNVSKSSERCKDCVFKHNHIQNKKNRPSYKQLKADLKMTNYSEVGRKYGVSDNAIRKWIKAHEKYGTTDT